MMRLEHFNDFMRYEIYCNCDDAYQFKTNLLTLTHMPIPDQQCINLLYREGLL